MQIELQTIDWNQLSELGLLQRINREILHPLGLAITRNKKTGCSERLVVADDGVWIYDTSVVNTVLSKEEVQLKLLEWKKS